jgi:hypothetical protein
MRYVALRVINQMGPSAVAHDDRTPRRGSDRVRGGRPAGDCADVFFDGHFAWDDIVRWIGAAGVRWVQTSGTGIDKVRGVRRPDRDMRGERARADSVGDGCGPRVGEDTANVAEAPPKHWNFRARARLGRRSTLAIVGPSVASARRSRTAHSPSTCVRDAPNRCA